MHCVPIPSVRRGIRALSFAILAAVLALLFSLPATAGNLHVRAARIGCLDIQHAPNLTAQVGARCNDRRTCSYKAPTPAQYRAAGVHAATRSFCTQAMQITYDCSDGTPRTVTVPGNAWKHPAAFLDCSPRRAGSPRGDVRTRFDPRRDGFHFVNSFKNDFIPALNIRTSGLCGGMDYAALDFFFAHRPIPRQDYRPANGTPLHKLLYDRQVRSIESNLTEWADLRTNPGGARNVELFRRGLDGRRGHPLQRLRAFIDRGTPVVLDMKGAPGTGDHQVIAIGYNAGRYRGAFGPYQDDVRIYVYDPNHPDTTMTLVPDTVHHVYHYVGSHADQWRSYFVDAQYRPRTPPRIPDPVFPHDGRIHALLLHVDTGGDDLRGGSANLDLEVDLVGGGRQVYRNINRSARWLPRYDQYVRVVLTHPLERRQIRRLVLRDTFHSGIGHDRWMMRSLQADAVIDNARERIAQAGSKYFTVADRELSIPVRH